MKSKGKIQNPITGYLYALYLKMTQKIQGKRWGTICHATTNQKKAGVATLILDKVYFPEPRVSPESFHNN